MRIEESLVYSNVIYQEYSDFADVGVGFCTDSEGQYYNGVGYNKISTLEECQELARDLDSDFPGVTGIEYKVGCETCIVDFTYLSVFPQPCPGDFW